MDEFSGWLHSELALESIKAQSHEYEKRKKANDRVDELRHSVRLYDEYAKLREEKSKPAPYYAGAKTGKY